MTQCRHFRFLLHNQKKLCLDKRKNFMGFGVLPCLDQNVGTCEGHSLREEDKPMEWEPVGKHNYKEVKRRSQLNFGDNPNQEGTNP